MRTSAQWSDSGPSPWSAPPTLSRCLLLVAIVAVVGAIGLQTTVSGVADQVPGGVTVLSIGALLPFIAVFAVVAYVVVMSPEKHTTTDGRYVIHNPAKDPTSRSSVSRCNLIEGVDSDSDLARLAEVIVLRFPSGLLR